MFGILKTYSRKFKSRFRSVFLKNVNWTQTIRFNFRMLPFQEAKHLPIWLYGKVDISHCCGKIQWLHGTLPQKTGSWKIGDGSWAEDDHLCPHLSIIDIRGNLILGENGVIRNGINMRVYGNFILHNNLYIGDNSKVYCQNSITIGENTHASWEVQLMDTNIHYVVHDDSYVERLAKVITIGSHCWIGNRAVISKGTRLGDYSIVASSSFVNKDFGDEKGCIYAGMPARKKAENCRRIFEDEELNYIRKIDKWFADNPDKNRCILDVDLCK